MIDAMRWLSRPGTGNGTAPPLAGVATTGAKQKSLYSLLTIAREMTILASGGRSDGRQGLVTLSEILRCLIRPRAVVSVRTFNRRSVAGRGERRVRQSPTAN